MNERRKEWIKEGMDDESIRVSQSHWNNSIGPYTLTVFSIHFRSYFFEFASVINFLVPGKLVYKSEKYTTSFWWNFFFLFFYSFFFFISSNPPSAHLARCTGITRILNVKSRVFLVRLSATKCDSKPHLSRL